MYVKEEGGGDDDEKRFFEDPVDIEESIDIMEQKVDTVDQVIEVNQDQEEEKGNEEEIDSEKDETAIVSNAIYESETMLETQVEIHIRIINSNHSLYPCFIYDHLFG